MADHRLKLVYDGLDAAQNHMPPSLERQIAEGMQILVGAQLAYFVEGRVPDRIMDRTSYYQLHDYRQRPACWIAELHIATATGIVAGGFFLGQVAKEVAGDLLKEFVKQNVRQFFADSYCDWKARRTLIHPPFERIEPVLDIPGKINRPVFDTVEEQEMQRRRLYGRMNDSMTKITAPVHRSASQVDIWFDDLHLDRITHRVYTDEEIEQALLPLRDAPRDRPRRFG